MVLSDPSIKIISKKLTLINQMIKLNNGKDLEKIKDELLSILQEIDIENHRCFTPKN